MVVADVNVLIGADLATLNPSDTDASHVVVVVDRGDQKLKLAVFVALGRRHIVQNLVKQGLEVGAGHVRILTCGSGSAGAVDHRAVKLFVGGVEVHQKLQNLVLHGADAGVRLVDLVDDDDDTVVQL